MKITNTKMNTKRERETGSFSVNRVILSSLIFTLVALFMPMSKALAAEHCGDEYYVDETLPNGARWDMCWEHRQREGIVFHHIYYTPKNGQRRMVLRQASIAQIHVPYDDNGSRFHDVSDYGIGEGSMLELFSVDCPNGTLLNFFDKSVLCKQIETQELSYKKGKNALKGHTLSLFSISPVAAYYYVPTWRFMDNGKIEPWLGATGALQRFGGFESRGWKLGDGRTGISHLHNFFWKLDFDLNGTPKNDVVEEINFPLKDGKRELKVTIFDKEASRKVDPNNMRLWRVVDKDAKNSNGHSISYDIVLGETGHQDIGPASEPFTHNDFYVSKQNDSERFASHNPGWLKNLAEYTNDENIVGEDIVIWTGVTFYHMPRSEDAPHMDAHWSHLEIIPRDWHASNPLGQKTTYNASPVVSSIKDQKSLVGDKFKLTVKASDTDELSYSASKLPEGLSIDKTTGVISGTLSNSGENNVEISVSDNESITKIDFNWSVKALKINHPPVMTAMDDQSGLVGDKVSLHVKAVDEDEDQLEFSATGLPDGLSLDNRSGVISGQLSSAGDFSVELKASDKALNAIKTFNWKVVSPVSNKVTNTDFKIDGLLNDWKNKSFFSNDPDDVKEASHQINWLKAAMAHSSHYIYLAYQNRKNIDPSVNKGSYLPAGWKTYLDTDSNAETGYVVGNIGADYVLEGTNILRYLGTGSSWAWEPAGVVKSAFQGKTAEISFNRALIGNPEKIRVVLVGDNRVFGGTGIDRYPDAGFFNYAFTGVNTENTPPVKQDQTISVGSGASISVILTATDVDMDTLAFSVKSQPKHGSLSGSAPNMIFTANSNFVGKDSFTFIASDSKADSQIATVTININSEKTGLAVSNFVKDGINVDGKADDWGKLTGLPDDKDDTKGVIDWKNITLAHNGGNLFLLYRNRGAIDPKNQKGSYLPWGWRAYIDTDKNAATGFKQGGMGADFIIEGNKLLSYAGRGNNWSWKFEKEIKASYQGEIAEVALPRKSIGNPVSIRVLFVGDNNAYQTDELDLYPDEQDDPAASIRYYIYDFLGDTSTDDRPVGFAQSITAYSGTRSIISLVAIDPNNDHLTFNVVEKPKHGKLTGEAPELVYIPDSDYIGNDSLKFNVNDGHSTSGTVSVLINVTGLQGGLYSNPVSTLSIDGNIEEWSGLAAFGDDADDLTIADSNKSINWQRAAVAHNAETFYFLYKNYTIINPDNNSGDYIDRGWQTFLDTDGKATTGYKMGNNRLGADYLIEGSQLLKYTGNGTTWSWSPVVTTTLKYNANAVEMSFPRSAIGNPDKVQMIFVGDNTNYGGDVDYYPDNKSPIVYQLKGDEDLITANRPVAKALSLEVKKASLSFDLIATDKDKDALTYHIVKQPTHGKIEGFNEAGKAINYKPNASYTGSDSFSYIANDGVYDSSVVIVSLNVKAPDTGNTNGSTSGGSTSGGSTSGGSTSGGSTSGGSTSGSDSGGESNDEDSGGESNDEDSGGGGGSFSTELFMLFLLVLLLRIRYVSFQTKLQLQRIR